jgi:RimJ/RimL family protein N-acetyltransferase
MEPLDARHAAGLLDAASEDLFDYLVVLPKEWTVAGFENWIDAMHGDGRVPFAAVLRETGQAVGTSSYLDIRPAHRALEIGHTWIGKAFHGGFVNPEMKYLMLRHAFEDLGAVRVQLKTDARNRRSQAAIAKAGAVW